MIVRECGYVNFRNLTDGTLNFSPNINIFCGKNGQGKTNFLEMIYFGATGKSFRTKKTTDTIAYKKNKNGVFVKYLDKISEKELVLKTVDGRKEYSYNHKQVKYDEYYGKLNVISYAPEDTALINDGPATRREFFDSEIAQSNLEYMLLLKRYDVLLKIRNKYLKEQKTESKEYAIYEDEFVEAAAEIICTRHEYTKMLSSLLNLNYRKLFDGTKELILTYKSTIEDNERNIERGNKSDTHKNVKKYTIKNVKDAIKAQINEIFTQEKRMGYSLVGPQRDDYLFCLQGHEAKVTSSQGEKRSIIFSLKLAEIDMILKDKKENPIFIIDDITSYFDADRLSNILKYLVKRNIQVFISSTEELEIDGKYFYVKSGEVERKVENGEIISEV